MHKNWSVQIQGQYVRKKRIIAFRKRKVIKSMLLF